MITTDKPTDKALPEVAVSPSLLHSAVRDSPLFHVLQYTAYCLV